MALSIKVSKAQVALLLGIVGAVSTYLSQHGLVLDVQTVSVLVGIVLAYLKKDPGLVL